MANYTNDAANGIPFLVATARNTLAQAAPYLPMSAHLILSALFPIYTGSHASLSRPASAAVPVGKSKKSSKNDQDLSEAESDQDRDEYLDDDSEGDEEDEEDSSSLAGQMEGLSKGDALLFPIMAGLVLGSLYLLIQYAGAALLNKLLGWYFSGMAAFSVGRLIGDGLAVVGGVVWPRFYTDGGRMWRVRPRTRTVVVVGGGDGVVDASTVRNNPLPGWLGSLSLGSNMSSFLWDLRSLLSRRFIVSFHLRRVASIKARLTLRTIVSFAMAVVVLLYANLIDTPWYITNLQGFAFSYTALQLLSPTTFTTGSLLLVALFFYDIYFVFYTPLMVTVATKLDVPIKLLFPRPEDAEGKKPGLAMLGLGDIVIPGIMVGLSLRFDLFIHYSRKQQRRQSEGKDTVEKSKYVPVTGKTGDRLWTRGWSHALPLELTSRRKASSDGPTTCTIESILPTFAKTYFYASTLGYTLGMAVTLIIMGVWGHAQPALLYLVPGVLGSIWLTALVRGELSQVLDFTDVTEHDGDDALDADGKPKDVNVDRSKDAGSKDDEKWWLKLMASIFGESFFGMAKNERNAKRLESAIAQSLQVDDGSDDKSDGRASTDNKGVEVEGDKEKKSFVGFSIYSAPARIRRTRQNSKENPSDKSGQRNGVHVAMASACDAGATGKDGVRTRRRG